MPRLNLWNSTASCFAYNVGCSLVHCGSTLILLFFGVSLLLSSSCLPPQGRSPEGRPEDSGEVFWKAAMSAGSPVGSYIRVASTSSVTSRWGGGVSFPDFSLLLFKFPVQFINPPVPSFTFSDLWSLKSELVGIFGPFYGINSSPLKCYVTFFFQLIEN